MRSKLYILLLLFALQACVKDEEKVFDAPATERINAAISACKTTLCAVTNGWIMEYYPESDRSKGGYNFICKFNANGTVRVACEMETHISAGDTSVSTYDLIADAGVVLSFNTYNEVLHYFTEPDAYDIDGYAGDHEFIISEATPNKVVLIGKKHGSRALLTPYTGGDPTTWKTYLEQFSANDYATRSLLYTVRVGGNALPVKLTRSFRAFRFAYSDVEEEIVPYIVTTTGIKLYEPLTIAGNTVQHFLLDKATGILTGKESNVVIKIAALATNRILSETNIIWELYNGSSSVINLLVTCNANLDAFRESFLTILIGDSPLINAPGRGMVFVNENDTTGRQEYSQFFFDFTPVDDAPANNIMEMTYKEAGVKSSKNDYYAAFKPFFDAIKAKSPYRVEVDPVMNPRSLKLISRLDQSFFLEFVTFSSDDI